MARHGNPQSTEHGKPQATRSGKARDGREGERFTGSWPGTEGVPARMALCWSAGRKAAGGGDESAARVDARLEQPVKQGKTNFVPDHHLADTSRWWKWSRIDGMGFPVYFFSMDYKEAALWLF